jgi:hypothetical protein
MEIRANKRWLQKRRRELLASSSLSSGGALLCADAAEWLINAAQPIRDAELQAVDDALQEMSTPEGAMELKRSLRAAKKMRKPEEFRIVVYGKFTRGKTGFMNAIVGEQREARPTDSQNVIELRPNKRWLAKRQKELFAADQSLFAQAELKAVEMASKALNNPRRAATFRKSLKQGRIQIVGGLAGGTGGATQLYTVVAPQRKKPRIAVERIGSIADGMGNSGALVARSFRNAAEKMAAKEKRARRAKKAAAKKASSRPVRKTGTQTRKPPKSR